MFPKDDVWRFDDVCFFVLNMFAFFLLVVFVEVFVSFSWVFFAKSL